MEQKMEQKTKYPVCELYYWKMCSDSGDDKIRLRGAVIGHPNFDDKQRIRTSRLVGMDLFHDYVLFHTRNTDYKCRYADCEEITEPIKELPALETRIKLALVAKEMQEIKLIEKIGLKEKEACLFVSSLKNNYFDKAFAIIDGKRVKCDCHIHTGTFQDSVIIHEPVSQCRDIEYAYLPYNDNRIEFYGFPQTYIYIVNIGFEDIKIDVPFGKFIVRAGGYEKIHKGNNAAE